MDPSQPTGMIAIAIIAIAFGASAKALAGFVTGLFSKKLENDDDTRIRAIKLEATLGQGAKPGMELTQTLAILAGNLAALTQQITQSMSEQSRAALTLATQFSETNAKLSEMNARLSESIKASQDRLHRIEDRIDKDLVTQRELARTIEGAIAATGRRAQRAED